MTLIRPSALVFAAVSTLLATPSATLGQPAASLITQPNWKAVPSAAQMLMMRPRAAMKNRVGGGATVACKVTTEGTLAACEVVSETPPGMGFGAAALALTPQFIMQPATRNGVPIEGEVRIPIKWEGIVRTPRAGSRDLRPPTSPWSEAPSWDDVVAAYPAKARAANAGGRSTILCDFRKDGGLTVCRWLSVSTPGMGFETAALSLARKFRLEGSPGRASVQLVFAFSPQMLDAGPRPVVHPTWLSTPSPDDIRSAFGGLAAPRVAMRCTVVAAGRLDGCKVASEHPAGAGARALGLAAKYRVSPWTDAGLPAVGGELEVIVQPGASPG